MIGRRPAHLWCRFRQRHVGRIGDNVFERGAAVAVDANGARAAPEAGTDCARVGLLD